MCNNKIFGIFEGDNLVEAIRVGIYGNCMNTELIDHITYTCLMKKKYKKTKNDLQNIHIKLKIE